jgi:hypothetical protein
MAPFDEWIHETALPMVAIEFDCWIPTPVLDLDMPEEDTQVEDQIAHDSLLITHLVLKVWMVSASAIGCLPVAQVAVVSQDHPNGATKQHDAHQASREDYIDQHVCTPLG